MGFKHLNSFDPHSKLSSLIGKKTEAYKAYSSLPRVTELVNEVAFKPRYAWLQIHHLIRYTILILYKENMYPGIYLYI